MHGQPFQTRPDDALAKEPENWQPESRKDKGSHWHTFDYETRVRLVEKKVIPPMWNAGCGACDNNYIMTSLLKVLRKLLHMGVLSSSVRSET